MSFIFIQKFNEKAAKAKKNQIQLVYFYIFILFLLPSFFFLKTLNTTPSVFLKHRILFYTVYCADVIFGNFWCTPRCTPKCKC
jgi:hypothetical protein